MKPAAGNGPGAPAGADTASSETRTWADAGLMALLFAIDPAGTGVALRAGAGPVREQWLAAVRPLIEPAPWRRLPLHIRDERLLGGLDLPATLQAGRPVAQRGVLAESDGGVLLLAMAERLESSTVARLNATLDSGQVVAERDGVALRHAARFGVVALDESAHDDERLASALCDRLAFRLDLRALSPRAALANDWRLDSDVADVQRARERLPLVHLPDDILVALCEAAAALGVDSTRAQTAALRVARAHAAWYGRDAVEAEDAAVAVRMVLAPRATRWPTEAAESAAEPVAEPPAEPEPPPEAQPEPETAAPENAAEPRSDTDTDTDTDAATPPEATPSALDDILLQAALAALPPDLLSRLKAEQAGRDAARAAGKAGALQKTGQRGRPIGARRGEPRGGQRLNVIETLRAAVPWQKLRAAADANKQANKQANPQANPQAQTGPRRIQVRAEDFHITRLRPKRQTTTIFAVDASGSSALNRLAEAKGAVELLLADCYVRRDQVAVVAFRGRTAEVLLPPTRSLVRAKRALAGLPGGGGTPLAAALQAVATLADAARRRGETALVVLLTDGRANVALDGTGGRVQAEADAMAAAQQLRAAGGPVLLIDTSPLPQAQAARLAEAMRAAYLPLPKAGAQAVSQAVSQAVWAASR